MVSANRHPNTKAVISITLRIQVKVAKSDRKALKKQMNFHTVSPSHRNHHHGITIHLQISSDFKISEEVKMCESRQVLHATRAL